MAGCHFLPTASSTPTTDRRCAGPLTPSYKLQTVERDSQPAYHDYRLTRQRRESQ